MQVAAVVQLEVQKLQDRHPAAKKVIIQSYNSSGFPLKELIPFVFNMNTRIHTENSTVLSRWILTEAQTGRT